MVNTANFPSGSMVRNTTAAQTQDVAMGSSGVPQQKTLMQMANMAFVPMSVSRSLSSNVLFPDRLVLVLSIPSLCTFSSSFLVDLDLLVFNISTLTLPKEFLSVEEFVTDSDPRPTRLLQNKDTLKTCLKHTGPPYTSGVQRFSFTTWEQPTTF